MEDVPENTVVEKERAAKMLDNYTNSSVYVNETVGAVLLAILAIILFIALRNSQKRYEALLAQMHQTG